MTEQNNKQMVKKLKVTAIATDPIYIGTGGYTIGRVDNTIVRDPITRLPKIPGSSLAGTWRYYMALELQSWLKEEVNGKLTNIKEKYNEKVRNDADIKSEEKDKYMIPENLEETLTFSQIAKTIYEKDKDYFYLNEEDKKDKQKAKQKIERFKKVKILLFETFKDEIGFDNQEWKKFEGNIYSSIKCAGQDDAPNLEYSEAHKDLGHCGHCIVCKSFGFSKRDISWQGMLYFSDLEILLFPVFTRLGTRWITTKERFKDYMQTDSLDLGKEDIVLYQSNNEELTDKTLNLGWLNLNISNNRWQAKNNKAELTIKDSNNQETKILFEDIIIVHEDLFSQIVNSNLEVRTSVSIDPLTGAAKEGALFTSEAIPRGTVFTGEIRIFEKDAFNHLDNKIGDLPSADCIVDALRHSKHYYESLGIGGMTTRGFGRMKIDLDGDFNCNKHNCKSSNEQNQTEQTQNQ